MPRVYISGPMTGLPELNFPAFNAAAFRLRALGHQVVNPAEVNPDTTMSWEQCMRADIKALCDCDTIALLPGWEASKGAHLEVHVAHRLGLRVCGVEQLLHEITGDGTGHALPAQPTPDVQQAYGDMKAAQPAAEPVLFMSPKQSSMIADPDDDGSGNFLPVRKTPAGNFTMALYAQPQPAAEPVLRNDPLSALAIRLLVAAGHVTQEKADEAFRIACGCLESEAAKLNVTLPWVTAAQPQPAAEPVATLHDDGCFTWKRDEFRRLYDSQRAGWRMDVYAAAQPLRELQPFDLVAHLHRQAEFSARTFGPGARVEGVTDHIAKELIEVRESGGALAEWVDVIILGLDGAWRSGASPEQIVQAIVAKQTKNEGRKWPDWRTAPAGKAIEHDRDHDELGCHP